MQTEDSQARKPNEEKESWDGKQDIQGGDHFQDCVVVQGSTEGLPGTCRRSTDRTDDNYTDALLLANSGGGSPRECVIMGVPARICRTA